MNTAHFNSLSLDELCILHQQVAASLTQRILVRKARLEERLQKIGLADNATRFDRKRRPIRPCVPNTAIRRTRRRHGRAAAGCLGGCGRNFEGGASWTIS